MDKPNKIICDLVTKQVKGLNRQCYPIEFVITYEGDLRLMEKYDHKLERGISIKEDFSKFNADEVLNFKFKKMLRGLDKNNLLEDMFIDNDHLDLTTYKCDTGVTLVSLHPLGFITTTPIKLKEKAKEFDILIADFNHKYVDMYINDVKVEGDTLTLPEEVDEIIIKFVNRDDDRFQRVREYAIAY